MVQGNFQNIQRLPWKHIAMHYNGQKMGKLQKPCPGVKWQNQMEQRTFSHLFKGTTKISTSITKSWSEVTPLPTVQRFSRAGLRGRAREWATLGVHPLSWLLSNNRLEEVCGTLTKGTFSSRLLLSNQDKGCTPSVAHSLPLPLPPGFCSTCLVIKNSGPCIGKIMIHEQVKR